MKDILGALLARFLDVAVEVGIAWSLHRGLGAPWPVALLLVVLWEINAMDARMQRLERPKNWWKS